MFVVVLMLVISMGSRLVEGDWLVSYLFPHSLLKVEFFNCTSYISKFTSGSVVLVPFFFILLLSSLGSSMLHIVAAFTSFSPSLSPLLHCNDFDPSVSGSVAYEVLDVHSWYCMLSLSAS